VLPSAIDEEPAVNIFRLLEYWGEEPPTHVILALRYLGQRKAKDRTMKRWSNSPLAQEMLGQGAVAPLPPHLREMAQWAEEQNARLKREEWAQILESARPSMLPSSKPACSQTVDEVKQAAQKIPLAFEEARGRTKTALNGISEDTKQAAQVVSIESAKVAQATKQFAAAQAELRNATVVAKDAKLDDAETTRLLAAAQQKAAAAAKELAEAKVAEARAVAQAAEQEELSQNVVIRAFQRAAAAVSEASAEIREQMVATAETGGLEAEGITAGFAGFSKLLGAGIAMWASLRTTSTAWPR
jgi:hypothetical protein